MAITTQLVGKLGGDKFEVKTVTGLGTSATASVPAGWKSCWVIFSGESSSVSARIFGKYQNLSGAPASERNAGGGTELSGAQTAEVSSVSRGGTFTYVRTG